MASLYYTGRYKSVTKGDENEHFSKKWSKKMLYATFFGHLHLQWHDEPIPLPTKSTAALLAYLLLERESPQPREYLAALLWPDTPEEKGRRNLRQTLLRLRKALPESWDGYEPLLVTPTTLQWNPNYPVDADIFRFDAIMRDLESVLPTITAPTTYHALCLLKQLSDLYTGDLLQDLTLFNDLYSEWLLPWRQRYQRQILAVLTRLAAYEADVGRVHRMEALARRQLTIDPEYEVAHRQLMQALLAQDEARAVVKHYQTAFGEGGTVPTPPSATLQRLHDQALALLANEESVLQPVPHNIPPDMTPFYGRDEEKEDILMRLATSDQRLITITGVGGIGKTRLAIAVARHFASALTAIEPRFPGGVWFVSLVDVTSADDDSVASVILQATDLQSNNEASSFDALVAQLQRAPTLLVLDNLEHLAGIRHIIARLLDAVPNLKILATSRRSLGLHVEIVRPLEGLPVPQTPHERTPSETLFLERFQRVGGMAEATLETRTLIGHICRTLEGWPLALELAAGWGNRLSLREIASKVAQNIEALQTMHPDVPARQRSIEAVLDGSYALLTPDQQRILQGFTIFQGGATAQALEKVLGARLEDLTMLVDRALLNVRAGRYTIHELIRQFAARHLEQGEWQEAIEEAHATYYLRWLVAQRDALFGAHPVPVVNRIRLERHNIERAWRWAVVHGNEDLLAETLPVLARFYRLAGLIRDGEALFKQTANQVEQHSVDDDIHLEWAYFCVRLGKYEQAVEILDRLKDAPLTKHQRAKWALLKGKIYMYQEPVFSKCRSFYEEALRLAEEVGDQEIMLASLIDSEILRNYDGRFMAQITELADSVNDAYLKRDVLVFLGAVSIHNRCYEEAIRYWRKALRIVIDLEDEYAEICLHNNLGDALREYGDMTAAEHAFRQAFQKAEKHHFMAVQPSILEGWARLLVVQGKYHRAIQLAERSIALSEAIGEQQALLITRTTLGHAYAGLRRWKAAQAAYQHVVEHVQDFPQVALEAIAGLAFVFWQQGDLAAAHHEVDRFLNLEKEVNLAGIFSPRFNYERIAFVLRALGRGEEALRFDDKGADFRDIA